MKNILIPILVLIFLVGAGIAEALIVNNIFEDFIAETDKLSQPVDRGFKFYYG